MLERANRPRERALQPPFCICEDSSEGHALTVGEKQARGRFCKFQWPSASSYVTVRAWKRNQDQNLEGISLRSLVSSCSAIFGLNSTISVRVQHLFVSLKPGLCFAWKYSSGFYSLPLLSVIFLLLLFSNKPFTLYNIFLLPDIICLLLIGCSLPSNFRSHIMPEKQPLFWRNKHHG